MLMKLTEELLYRSAPLAEQLWLDAMPRRAELPEHKFSLRFERRMRKLIREQSMSPKVLRFRRTAKRIVAGVLIAFTIGFSGMMTVEAFRAQIVSVISKIFPEYTEYHFTSTYSADTPFGDIEFGYFPNELQEVEKNRDDDFKSLFIQYQDGQNNPFYFHYDVLTENTNETLILDTEDADVSTIKINDIDTTLIEKDNMVTLMWKKGAYRIRISGYLSKEEMIKMAEEIKIKNY